MVIQLFLSFYTSDLNLPAFRRFWPEPTPNFVILEHALILKRRKLIPGRTNLSKSERPCLWFWDCLNFYPLICRICELLFIQDVLINISALTSKTWNFIFLMWMSRHGQISRIRRSEPVFIRKIGFWIRSGYKKIPDWIRF